MESRTTSVFQEDLQFHKSRHAKYFKRHLDLLPERCAGYDSMRVTLLFFAISGLDVLDNLNDTIDENKRQAIIEWIYLLQVVPNQENTNLDACGFQGSTTLNFKYSSDRMDAYRVGNLALTYSALCTLIILGDDLSRVNKKAVLTGVKALQEKSGRFKCTQADSDCDMRFVFCAASICYILNDWSGMDQSLCIDFILKSFSYDYAFAQGPNLESHGGSTYCALSSLALMNNLHLLSEKQIAGLRKWLIFRQKSSFQGRPNKPVDTCYTFWVGASLNILEVSSWIEEQFLLFNVLKTQDTFGGFSKCPDVSPDLLHTYLGIAGLSLLKSHSFNLLEVHPALNITRRAYDHLKSLHRSWS